MIGTTPGVIKVPKGAVFIRVKPYQFAKHSITITDITITKIGFGFENC